MSELLPWASGGWQQWERICGVDNETVIVATTSYYHHNRYYIKTLTSHCVLVVCQHHPIQVAWRVLVVVFVSQYFTNHQSAVCTGPVQPPASHHLSFLYSQSAAGLHKVGWVQEASVTNVTSYWQALLLQICSALIWPQGAEKQRRKVNVVVGGGGCFSFSWW